MVSLATFWSPTHPPNPTIFPLTQGQTVPVFAAQCEEVLDSAGLPGYHGKTHQDPQPTPWALGSIHHRIISNP